MFKEEIIAKYNALPSEKHEDIDNFILTICESEKQKQLRQEVEARHQEAKLGEKVSSLTDLQKANPPKTARGCVSFGSG